MSKTEFTWRTTTDLNIIIPNLIIAMHCLLWKKQTNICWCYAIFRFLFKLDHIILERNVFLFINGLIFLGHAESFLDLVIFKTFATIKKLNVKFHRWVFVESCQDSPDGKCKKYFPETILDLEFYQNFPRSQNKQYPWFWKACIITIIALSLIQIISPPMQGLFEWNTRNLIQVLTEE